MPSRPDPREEMEANYFAMCLLIPEKFLRADLDGQPPFDVEEDPRVQALAKRYQVSEQLMMRRLIELGYFGKVG